MIGEKFSNLTIIQRKENNHRKEKMYECLCSCGNITIVKLINLKSGTTKSCGCLKTGPKPKNYSGIKINRLTILKSVGKSKCRTQKVLCECECGNKIETFLKNVITNKTKSCGCWFKEFVTLRIGPNNPNYNLYITDEERNKRLRNMPGLGNWRKTIISKGVCENCFSTEKLTAHHIESWDINEPLRLDINNGACLCYVCHDEFHNIYGRGKNNRTQFNQFLGKI